MPIIWAPVPLLVFHKEDGGTGPPHRLRTSNMRKGSVDKPRTFTGTIACRLYGLEPTFRQSLARLGIYVKPYMVMKAS